MIIKQKTLIMRISNFLEPPSESTFDDHSGSYFQKIKLQLEKLGASLINLVIGAHKIF